MLWVNLIMDSLASLSLATENPNDKLLDDVPVNPDANILTPMILNNIAFQTTYQLFIMFLILFYGRDLLLLHEDDNTHLFCLTFNTFVWMQLFNQVLLFN